ncbi:lysylphosphatidylglycerol synthase transmembrane domain-containing protein [Salisediminibacterium halotolerans]|uniref:lysylphosphatidylglycerol synthase transmembrane domain-containing protein n=1 Tax=Salisediminibacterium halotolerans TaxID=517425 RepID=UPI000EB0A141|nr:lysylphosphatidylglycerol synthase transmembrane domain-containing protein [Salisediminibacterium halotolerans]RLJ71663.1 hypothetical protein BCL39_2334 [Actinophytocola xinjiangensis]RPE86813.1 hypothetical protein EDD67_1675 [Salisediminibacterium halotolerans]TWG32876.1 hypothetical protein BCL52_2329 [Salisediminibacterium halotolerans]GEL06968.1 TIGR00374 family protein [Salisediminibacterium halotolerans]
MIRYSLFAVVFALLIYTFLQLDHAAIIDAIAFMNAETMILLVLIQFASFQLMAVQWGRILHVKGAKAHWNLVRILFMSAFTEGVTPSVKFGGELTKGVLIKEAFALPVKTVFAYVTMQKLISIAGIFPFLGVAIWIWRPANLHISMFIVFFGLILFVLLLLRWKHTIFERILNGITGREWLVQLVIATMIWTLFPLKGYLLAHSFGLDVSFPAMLAIVFMPYLAAMIPVTPGGIGTFEATMTAVFIGFGAEAEAALAFTLVFRFITFWLGVLTGGVITVVELSIGRSISFKKRSPAG